MEQHTREEREQKLAWLSRGRQLRTKLIGLYAERQERVSRAEYAGISYDGMNSRSSGNGTERKLAAIEQTEEEISETEEQLAVVEAEIREAIAVVRQPIYQTYLRMRFLGYRTERQIAEETRYSLEHIRGYIRRNSLDCIKINPK